MHFRVHEVVFKFALLNAFLVCENNSQGLASEDDALTLMVDVRDGVYDQHHWSQCTGNLSGMCVCRTRMSGCTTAGPLRTCRWEKTRDLTADLAVGRRLEVSMKKA